MQIGAQSILPGVHDAALLGLFSRGDHQHRHVVEREADRLAAGQADRVLEGEMLSAVGTQEVALYKVAKNTFFTVRGTTAWGSDCVFEEFIVNGTSKGGVCRWFLANFGRS